jgi:hypothetical protein
MQEPTQSVIVHTNVEITRMDGPCPNDFLQVTTVKVWRKTKKAATKAFEDRLEEILPTLEKVANCSQHQCDDGICEFDYMIDGETPRKIYLKTKKGKKRRRWIVNADVFFGCFCPDADDDPENDPPENFATARRRR